MQNADLAKKCNIVRKWKIINQKKIKILEIMYKNGKNYKIWWYWNPKTKLVLAQRTYFNEKLIKIVLSNQISFGRKGFKYFIGYKDAEKLYIFH